MAFGQAGIWGGGDTALPLTSPRVVDRRGTPGDYSVATGVRVMGGKVAVGFGTVLITHPDITASSLVDACWEGNATASPEATKRHSCRPVAGGIVFSLSSGAIADDGPFVVEVLAV